MQEILIRN